MRRLIRCILPCLVATGGALPVAARARTTERPVTVASLKADANRAAARYAEAQTISARLGDQISGLERQVSDLEAGIGPLRNRITRQAVAVYEGDVAVAAVAQFEAAAATLRSDRSVHLVSQITARDIPAIGALVNTKQRLRDRQAELAARRHDQDVTIANLASQREQITAQLAALAAALPPAFHLPSLRASRSSLGKRRRKVAPPPFICPIDGPLAFSDDFGAPRNGGRRHMGNDLLSPSGTPNVAVVDGTIETRPWSGGGITIFLAGDDGTTYVYMHLQEIVGAVPRRVSQGELIGLVGATGDAQGYHTHFEVHPGNGPAIDPFPLVSEACR
jgi:murein DD-endopeptidase MepM/ murein hydrolase activator NlpD